MDGHCFRNKVCYVCLPKRTKMMSDLLSTLVASYCGLIFVNKRNTTKSTIYIPQKFLRVWCKEWTFIVIDHKFSFCQYFISRLFYAIYIVSIYHDKLLYHINNNNYTSALFLVCSCYHIVYIVVSIFGVIVILDVLNWSLLAVSLSHTHYPCSPSCSLASSSVEMYRECMITRVK